MDNVIIHQIPTGPFQVFTYLVACPRTREAVLIDPAGEDERLLSMIESENLKVKYILNTHGHADHILGNEKLKSVLSVPVCMHEVDDDFFSQEDVRSLSEKELGLAPCGSPDIRLKDGDLMEVGSLKIEVIHTPGHTPGSVCYMVNKNLFTGDTLFVGAAGRTDLVGGSIETLLRSIEKKLLHLPDDTVVWPGHDYGETPSSSMGREKEENIYITDFLL